MTERVAMSDERLSSASVWVVHYGNAFPREVDSVWLTRDGAERRASILVSYRVEEWPVGERIGVDD